MPWLYRAGLPSISVYSGFCLPGPLLISSSSFSFSSPAAAFQSFCCQTPCFVFVLKTGGSSPSSGGLAWSGSLALFASSLSCTSTRCSSASTSSLFLRLATGHWHENLDPNQHQTSTRAVLSRDRELLPVQKTALSWYVKVKVTLCPSPSSRRCSWQENFLFVVSVYLLSFPTWARRWTVRKAQASQVAWTSRCRFCTWTHNCVCQPQRATGLHAYRLSVFTSRRFTWASRLQTVEADAHIWVFENVAWQKNLPCRTHKLEKLIYPSPTWFLLFRFLFGGQKFWLTKKADTRMQHIDATSFGLKILRRLSVPWDILVSLHLAVTSRHLPISTASVCFEPSLLPHQEPADAPHKRNQAQNTKHKATTKNTKTQPKPHEIRSRGATKPSRTRQERTKQRQAVKPEKKHKPLDRKVPSENGTIQPNQRNRRKVSYRNNAKWKVRSNQGVEPRPRSTIAK